MPLSSCAITRQREQKTKLHIGSQVLIETLCTSEGREDARNALVQQVFGRAHLSAFSQKFKPVIAPLEGDGKELRAAGAFL